YTAIEDTHIDKATNRFTSNTTYDDAGQVINDAKFRSMSFAYDANGRQVKAVRSGVPDAWTVYDALGNRVATKINDVWQYVVYDAFGKCVAEYGQLADGVGGVKYVQQDWQGSVRTVTNANGFVVSRTDHQAFGGEVGYGTGQRSIEQGYNRDAATRQGYGLTERDDASGLDHTWFRKNENSAGRWTSPDPYKGSMNLGDPQSFNRYSYVQNQPTNFVDPSGLQMAFCITYEYGMEYKFEDGTIIRVPEGTNTICFGGGPPETGPPNPGPGSSGTGGTSATNPARDKNADNKLNNCMINATGDWARANARAYSDLKRTVARTALLTGVGLIFAREVGGIALGGSSAYFAHEDYRIAMNRNNDDLERSTRKCLGDNPNASRSAKNLAVNEANTNIGETRIQYF
ncbi:MAG: hypothetical protein IT173_08370, partial [Acidobacteria bacterium]|nr:hypothetical protein [Acidobacteriota bacterium]